MEWQLLDKIPFVIDQAGFLARMRIKPGSRREEDCKNLIAQAQDLAELRAVYLPRRVEALSETGMTVNGIHFESSLFAPRLHVGKEIYFYLATCGSEISDWRQTYRDDMVRYFWADCLAEQALQVAVAMLTDALNPFIGDEHLSNMNPGSLPEWPIEEQRPLFNVLGSAVDACGVHLNKYCVMEPQKSVSGFYFKSAQKYCNCELCQRQHCPNRLSAFNGQ